MSRGALLRKLKTLGLLGPCERHGLISAAARRDLDIEDRVNSLQRSGMGKNQAVLQIAAEMNMNRANVYRALRRLD